MIRQASFFYPFFVKPRSITTEVKELDKLGLENNTGYHHIFFDEMTGTETKSQNFMKTREDTMESIFIHEEAMKAQLALLAINFSSWRPDINRWLHSEDSETSLREMLQYVPCMLIH